MEMSLLGPDGVSHSVPHVETLTMNRKERNRITIMVGVKAKVLSQVQAAELLGLSYRQAKRGYEFCQRGALEHSGRSCSTDGSGVTLRTCWSANPQVGFREMLVDCNRSHSPFPLNEHRRKAPTWGPPRIPECM